MNTNEIDVSVYVLTYYHEDYISQAIESILKQKTHYHFEIVISDDCSKDHTRDIVNKYCEKYPGIIRAIFNQKNIGIPKNMFQARCACKGRYIVVLSGDDYWINESKIELQASFLDTHPEYVAVFNGIEMRYDNDQFPYAVLPKKKDRNVEYSIKDYEKGTILRSHGFMMRNFFLSPQGRDYFEQAQRISDKVDDAVDMVLLLQKGKVFILDQITDAHRVVRGNKDQKHNYNSKYKTLEKFQHSIQLLNNMDVFFINNGLHISFEKKYIASLRVAEIDMLISGQIQQYRDIFRTIPSHYLAPFYKNVIIRAIPYAFIFGVTRIFSAIRAMINRKNT